MSLPIVLASGSAIRAKVLRDAGVAFSVVKPGVDEGAIKARMTGASGEDIALALAREKALAVSRTTEGVVIGGDQILRFGGELFDKVDTMEAVRARLRALSGRTHDLVGGVVLARGDVVLEDYVGVSKLTMRAVSDAMIEWYLEQEGEALLASVGCYQFENAGAQLFEAIDGDYFAILGLPLLPTLAMLRSAGALME